MNIAVQVSVQVPVFNYFGYVPLEVELLNHMVILFFDFLRNFHTVFPQQLHHFIFPLQCTRVLISPHPLQHLSFSVCFLIIAILMALLIFKTVDTEKKIHKVWLVDLN